MAGHSTLAGGAVVVAGAATSTEKIANFADMMGNPLAHGAEFISLAIGCVLGFLYLLRRDVAPIDASLSAFIGLFVAMLAPNLILGLFGLSESLSAVAAMGLSALVVTVVGDVLLDRLLKRAKGDG